MVAIEQELLAPGAPFEMAEEGVLGERVRVFTHRPRSLRDVLLRAREFGETRGFMKILVDADSKEILGAALLGLNGDEAVHALLDIMYAREPYTVISRAVHIHPTVSELIPTVLQSLRPLV